ncbi:phenoloxidase-activating factor 3-like [Rhagoletis pomonella]|uniref:phenoloxidase-activating factor 3-like n=1 Tax=Rhagoletis pomonella TaxID=28610 RepID=UPI0017861CF3|nr:phenoloxidase-activating factor 3-like [Rhagoletis pomonella]
MARCKIIVFTFLIAVSVCNWSAVSAAGRTLCRTTAKKVGYCAQFENCPAMRDVMLFPEMLNNNDCENSGISGAVICCPYTERRMRQRKTTTTAPPTTTTTTATTTTPTATPTAAAFPSRNDNDEEKNSNSLTMENLHPDGLALLNKHKCGKVLDDRVANGEDVAFGEFPWVAMLLYGEKQPLCGGSVITDRFILTAAHCIKSTLNLVRLGEHAVSTEVDCIANVLCVTYQEFGIEKTIKHPDYDYATKKDIALIKLNDTIRFSNRHTTRYHVNIKPICLPTTPEEFTLLPDSDLIIAGWGLKENDEPADILQKGLLKPEALEVCKRLYARYSVDDSKICSRSVKDMVSCRGDSGGPMFWKTRDRTRPGYFKNRYVQIGLVSLGYMHRCGNLTNVPFMFENVTHSMAWITHNILS